MKKHLFAMATTLAQKLKIKESFVLYLIHAPANFERTLAPLPEGVKISNKAKNFNQVHWFVKTRAEMEDELESILKIVNGDILCWIYYPKGSSKIQTDLTRDKGWDKLLEHKELHWISLISFDDTWSAFAFRHKTEKDKKADTQPKERAIFQYIDAATKTIHLPEDFDKALKQQKSAATFFETLSFTNKKEYVEWIVSAKRKETRQERVNASLERLLKNWKNSANR